MWSSGPFSSLGQDPFLFECTQTFPSLRTGFGSADNRCGRAVSGSWAVVNCPSWQQHRCSSSCYRPDRGHKPTFFQKRGLLNLSLACTEARWTAAFLGRQECLYRYILSTVTMEVIISILLSTSIDWIFFFAAVARMSKLSVRLSCHSVSYF